MRSGRKKKCEIKSYWENFDARCPKKSGLCVDISWQKEGSRETRFFEFSSSLCLTARVTKATFSPGISELQQCFTRESPRQKGVVKAESIVPVHTKTDIPQENVSFR